MRIATRLRFGLASLAVLGVLASSPASRAEDSPVRAEARSDGRAFEVRYTAVFSAEALSFGEVMGYETVRLEGTDGLREPGKPNLPAETVRIALPAGMRVTRVRPGSMKIAELPGQYCVFPAQPPTPITDAGGRGAFVEPDPHTYSLSSAYPAERVEFLHQTDLAGQSMAVVRLHPVTYVPATGKLSLATSIEVLVEGIPGYACGDYLPRSTSRRTLAAYERRLTGMAVNPDDVELRTSPAPPSRGVGPGEYEYVIITGSDWVDDFQPLADWRTKRGSPATIVTTDWIYTSGGYAGSDVEKVRAFVEDAHDNWGTTDFLLGGDTNVIPYHVRTITVPDYTTDDIPNDTYYADYDEDWVCEVNVGRAPVRTAANVAVFISKVSAYEKNPPPTGYVTTAAFFGLDISECGDGYGENHKENYIRAPHLPPSWTFQTEYDSEPGTHRADILAYLNQGNHLVNHHDHCNTDCMGTGWICHSQLIYTSDVSALTNGDRQSILFAVGCYPCDFPAVTSIGEAFVRNPDGGGVAFMGNSRTGWGGAIEDPDYYSARQDHYFWRNLFDKGIERIGENFTILKNDEFDPYDPYNLHKYCFTQLHLLGDPGMPVWTEDPEGLTVTHDETLTVGQYTTFPVQVSSGRSPVDGATVCLWKVADVYEVEQTSGGTATFGFTPGSEGTLYVTVTLHNHVPYEGEAVVQEDATSVTSENRGLPRALELVSTTPNPFNPTAEITYAIPPTASPLKVRLAVYDCLGRHVRTLVEGEKTAGIHRASWDGRDDKHIRVGSGVYFCELRWSGETRTRRMVLIQ